MKKEDYQKRYKVAAVQFEPTIFKKSKNLQKLLKLAETAARQDAKLIVLPEMAATGYCWYSQEEIRQFAEPIPGPTTARFAEISNAYSCFIVVGLPEVDLNTGSLFNSVAFIGPNRFMGKYRKTHLFVADSRWAQVGNLGFPIYDTEIGLISGLICQDLMYFEPARILGLKRADVICCPSNWLRESNPTSMWAIRAFENGVYIIFANRWGEERGVIFHGNSCIVNPDGSIQNNIDKGDGIIFSELYINVSGSRSFELTEKKEKTQGRQPRNYQILSLNPYIHNPTRFFKLNNYRPLPQGQRSLAGTIFMRLTKEASEDPFQKVYKLIDEVLATAPAPIDLIVFPEICSDTKTSDRSKTKKAYRVPGKQIASIERYAFKYSTYIVLGLVEKDGDELYEAVVFVGPEGYVGKYRKLHISPNDKKWSSKGDLGFQKLFDS